MGSFLMIGLLLVPPSVGVVLAVAFGRVLDPALVTGFCVLYGLAVYFIALWLAGILLRRRVPEVVAWVQVQ
jgi:hypothetical protein